MLKILKYFPSKDAVFHGLKWIIIATVVIVPFLWMQVYHPVEFHTFAVSLAQSWLWFTAGRALVILGLFLFWPKLIGFFAKRRDWPLEQKNFWLSQRLRVCLWLGAMEMMLLVSTAIARW